MATFHHIISRLESHVIRYQLPYNQFSLPYKQTAVSGCRTLASFRTLLFYFL
ncbi:hypothetical protein [Clostridium sp. AF32-12BH]|uniref:hypothetical protein n=1 Tax=Clostridium sp. AF32-12BH TaxID=2292006 RepID=UPI0015FAA845|nr:hypothetical protein [Clostridium sp. AF32-12BH]